MFKPHPAILCVVMAACADDDAARNIEVTEFEINECKSSSTRGELATGRETADLAGLECVAWRFSANSTEIDLINWVEGCGFQGFGEDETMWKAELEQRAANFLRIGVLWDFEGPSACGNCLHDFSISAAGAAVTEKDLSLLVATRTCTDDELCDWTEREMSVDGKEGIRCRYIEWDRAGTSGEFRGKLGGPTHDGACDDPLVATEVAGDERCLQRCGSNADCPSLMACVDETCQLRETE